MAAPYQGKVRGPLRRVVPPEPWIEAFYVEYRTDWNANHPYIKPLSVRRIGPYSSYAAAMEAGMATPACSDFSVEKRYCNPRGERPVFLDMPQELGEATHEPNPNDDGVDLTLDMLKAQGK